MYYGYFQKDFATYTKADESPLTDADLVAHNTIVKGLAELTPEIPVLSEEATDISWQVRQAWQRYWLIDPLDGTKEFIKKNGEFTVNIALIQNNKPVWGVVYAPVLGWTYYGGTITGNALKVTENGESNIQIAKLPTHGEAWQVVGSRSHQSPEFAEFVKQFALSEIISMGSSLKLCLVAEGAAHIYPRLGLSSEWDTAAADAVLRGAGGQCLQVPSSEPITYNLKENMLNPYFICCSEVSNEWIGAVKAEN